jgi:hypothetical protein
MDSHEHHSLVPEHQSPPWWRTRGGLVLLGFLAIGAYFLITEHRAHLALAIPYLPWLLFLACPLMHLFMHGGHGGGGHGGRTDERSGPGASSQPP